MKALLMDLLQILFGGRLPDGSSGVAGGISVPIGSGYSAEAERAARVARLNEAGQAAIADPRWAPGQPLPDNTHCNGGAEEIAEAMGYLELLGLMADQQIDVLEQDPRVREDSMERFSEHAQRGGLCFATFRKLPHGHIAAGAPMPMQRSDTWGEMVPMIFNVGHENKLCKLSGGFLLEERPQIRFFLVDPELTA